MSRALNTLDGYKRGYPQLDGMARKFGRKRTCGAADGVGKLASSWLFIVLWLTNPGGDSVDGGSGQCGVILCRHETILSA